MIADHAAGVQIRNFISDLNTSRDVSFVASIGEDSDYPDSQYKFFERNSFIKKIKLEPIENKSELFKQLVKQILQYYNDEKISEKCAII